MSTIKVDTIKSRTDTAPTLAKGVIVSAAATFSDDVTIDGALTYDDVIEVDSIGIVTARKGIRATAGGIHVLAGVSTFADRVSTSSSITISAGGLIVDQVNASGVSTFVGLSTYADGLIVTSGLTTAGAGLTVTGDSLFAVTHGTPGTGTTIGLGGINVSGIVTVAQGAVLNGYKVEEGSYDSTALNGEFDFEFENGHIQTHTGSTAGTYFPDFRVSSSQSLSSVMGVGDVVSATLIVAASNTGHYCTTGIKIDNSTSNLTIEWVGSAAPSAGKGAGYDIYAFTIQKTAATPAYLIIVNAIDAG